MALEAVASPQYMGIRSFNLVTPIVEFTKPLNFSRVTTPESNPLPTLYTLCMEPGTWTTTPIEGGMRATESFIVFSNSAPEQIIFAVKQVRILIELAKRLTNKNSFDDEVQLWSRAKNEKDARAAIVYGGSIEPLDNTIVNRTLARSASRFLITFERDAWEHQAESSEFGAEWRNISTHGGWSIVPSSTAIVGDLPGRIKTFVIRTYGGAIDRVWMGIKDATGGSLAGSVFDPTINCGTTGGGLAAGTVYGSANGSVYPSGSSDTNFSGGKGWRMPFTKTTRYQDQGNGELREFTEWATRVRFPISNWNSYTATAANLPYYLGEYDLLLRYKTTDIGDAKIGIRAITAYAQLVNPTYLERLYITNTDNEFRYINLGRFRVGGEGWTRDARARAYLNAFSIYLETTLIDGDWETDLLYLDNMYLVPTDHSLYFKMEKDVASGGRIELYGRHDGSVDGYVVGNNDADGPGPLPTLSELWWQINEIKAENWAWPVDLGSAFVIVADRAEPLTKSITATCDIEVAVARRSSEFAS